MKHSCRPLKSGCASSTVAPSSAKRSAALRVIAATSLSAIVTPRSADQATRFGRHDERAAASYDSPVRGNENGSRGSSPLIASSNSAQSSTLRAIGPCWPRFIWIAPRGVCATRPMLGRKPTMPLKLAGLRNDPPISEPGASQAVPVASATAAPPEEPAAERDVFHGLRVLPNTSLKVLAPAPNSGVFDIA